MSYTFLDAYSSVQSADASVISGTTLRPKVDIASVLTTIPVTFSGSPSISGAVTMVGTPSISGAVTVVGTPSISGSVTIVGNSSVSGTVNIGNTPSISGAVQISGLSPSSIASVQRLDQQIIGSTMGLAAQAVIHGLTSAGGGSYVDVKVDPSGALVTTASSVVTFQGGSWTASISGTVSTNPVSSTWSILAPTASIVSGVTSVITGTSSVLVLAAAPGAQRNYVTQLLVTNAAAAGTFVDIIDNGTIIYTGYAAASGGGFSASFPTPLKQPTSVLALYTTTRAQASVIVSANGYTGA